MICNLVPLGPQEAEKVTLTLTGTGRSYTDQSGELVGIPVGCSIEIDDVEYTTPGIVEVDAGTEILCHCTGFMGGEVWLNDEMVTTGEDYPYTANHDATIEFDISSPWFYLRITET